MIPDPEFKFTAALDATSEPIARLIELLRGARGWFETARLERLVESLLADASCRALFDSSSDRIDHVGFLLPSWAKPLVSQAATSAGFPLGHRAFPSVLVAREFGRLVGRRLLDTMIFKAHGRVGLDAAAAFEAFIPAIDDAQTEEWIRRGIGNHVAIVISAPARFTRIRDAFGAAGVRMSSFMNDRAIYLHGEDATIMYFDLECGEYPFRLEVRAHGDQVGG